ncbi:MAG: hypothetical protein CMN78_03320 [Spirochaetales bacterium]|nr:hypothetical protein [Spirochaetales bacterium]
MGLVNSTVVNEPVERHSAKYDLVCCRAFMSFDEALPLLLPRVAEKGALLFYKGKRTVVDDELSYLPPKMASRIIKISVPFLNDERHLLLLRQTNR